MEVWMIEVDIALMEVVMAAYGGEWLISNFVFR